MPYTTEDGGRLNNFANEPKVYKAEPPSDRQKVNYVVLGAVGMILVIGLIFVAFSVSSLS
ncbi:MAG: ssl1498 family light-harvesting-like protein [Scytonema sp. PMC 1070.18]|nr:ssl1498 family light-harvesting-like protein [Scytonema sp. PMC 1070.18]